MTLAAITRNAMCNAIVDLLDAGKIEIYTGTAPNADAAATGTLLATLDFSNPAFGNAATGQATANAITQDATPTVAGTAGYARADASGGATIIQWQIPQDGSFSPSDTFCAGSEVSITSLTVSVPAS